MATTLYRKYRPQTFADVVNQQHVRLTIGQALTHDRVAHAYLFSGPRGVGKTTVARLLARAAACLDRKRGSEPCNQCASCQAMLQNASLDLVEIDAASQTGVDNVRENVIQSARAVPTLGKVKAFIIDEVHMLSLAAFNALLKLLEEPPSQTLFILATTEMHRVPATIISRTQRFDFKPLTIADIVQRIELLTQREQRDLEPGIAERIARTAGGSLRDAESILGQLFSFGEKKITAELADLVLPRSDTQLLFSLVTAVTLGRTTAALDLFHRYCQEGGDIPILVHELVEYSRVLMLATIDPAQATTVAPWATPDELKQLLDLAKSGSTDQFIKMLEAFLGAERQLPTAAMEELPVEIAIIKIGRTGAGTTPGAPSSLPKSTPASPTGPKATTLPIEKKTPTGPRKKPGTLLIENVQALWPDLRTQIVKDVPSLKIALQTAEIAAVEEHTITLAVAFPLYVERLQRPAAHQDLADAFSQKLGQNVAIVISTSATQPTPPSAPAVPASKSDKKNEPPSKGDLWDQVVASFR